MIYKGIPVRLEWSRYAWGQRLCLTLMSGGDDPEPAARVTVNLPEESLPDGCSFVQDWSEGEGMLEWLQIHDLARPTGRRVKSGHVLVPEVQWLPGSHWSAGGGRT